MSGRRYFKLQVCQFGNKAVFLQDLDPLSYVFTEHGFDQQIFLLTNVGRIPEKADVYPCVRKVILPKTIFIPWTLKKRVSEWPSLRLFDNFEKDSPSFLPTYVCLACQDLDGPRARLDLATCTCGPINNENLNNCN